MKKKQTKNKTETRTCKQCKKPFTFKRTVGRAPDFCGNPECKKQFLTTKRKENKPKHGVCKICGKKTPSLRHSYCSEKCKNSGTSPNPYAHIFGFYLKSLRLSRGYKRMNKFCREYGFDSGNQSKIETGRVGAPYASPTAMNRYIQALELDSGEEELFWELGAMSQGRIPPSILQGDLRNCDRNWENLLARIRRIGA